MWKSSFDIASLQLYRGLLDPKFHEKQKDYSNVYKKFQIQEHIRKDLIERFANQTPLKRNVITNFFNSFRILSLDEILLNIQTKIEELQKVHDGIHLLYNTSWLGARSYVYKSEEFLILELLNRKMINIPIWNLTNLEGLPEQCIVLDDACYSGSQMRSKFYYLSEEAPDTHFHIVLAFATSSCVKRLNASLKNIENISLYVGEIMPTAGEVTENDLEWLEPSDHTFENRSLKQPSSDYSELAMCTPDYKIADERSTFTAYFAELTNTQKIEHEHYKKWKQMNFET